MARGLRVGDGREDRGEGEVYDPFPGEVAESGEEDDPGIGGEYEAVAEGRRGWWRLGVRPEVGGWWWES